MVFPLALLLAARQAPTTFWRLGDVLELANVARGGRTPFSTDLAMAPSADLFTPAKEGDHIVAASGRTIAWTTATAKNGTLGDVPGGAYVQALIRSDAPRDAILTISGNGGAWLDGAHLPGDVYGYGYLSLPVALRAGVNQLLVTAGRGGISARLDAPRAPQQFNLADPTMPDVVVGETGRMLGGVVVLNTSGETVRDLKICAYVGNESVVADVPELPPHFLRKVPFWFRCGARPAGKARVYLFLKRGGRTLDSGFLDVRVVPPLASHRETFSSSIDGSVQYYAVDPALKPSPTNALVLTLHGAGVEASGQAAAYASKDWCTIVAATNRRPYGFDWEDMGRMDALEVLKLAKARYLHDPARVELTGHSMGGHGTWSIGTLYPNLFAAIAPSAGWISFTTYAGGYDPRDPTATQRELLAAATPSDTLARVRNTLEEHTYILHGSADDNVPVTEARRMDAELTKIGASVTFHEQPGAGHWWGNQCVDWPPLFALLRASKLRAKDDPAPLDFSTPDPAVSSTLRWATIERTVRRGESEVKVKLDGADRLVGTTANVGALELRRPAGAAAEASVALDGQTVRGRFPIRLERRGGTWTTTGAWEPGWKSPARDGLFKLAFQHRMVFVVGSGAGSADLWNLARDEAEALYYRGNGAVDVWSDREYLARRGTKDVAYRNVILFGNADTNAAWPILLAGCPLKVSNAGVSLGTRRWTGANQAALVVYPLAGSSDALVAGFGACGPLGCRLFSRLPMFFSGVAYPDWTVVDAAREPSVADRAVEGAGNFGPDWREDSNDQAFEAK